MAAKRVKLTLHVSADDFTKLGADIMNRGMGFMELTFRRRFLAHFGVTENVVADTWQRLEIDLETEKDAQPVHLLWALFFLKTYNSESVCASAVGTADEKTFRKWSKFFVERISSILPMVVSTCCISLLSPKAPEFISPQPTF